MPIYISFIAGDHLRHAVVAAFEALLLALLNSPSASASSSGDTALSNTYSVH